LVLDVRKQSEYDSEHVKGVKNFPLGFINHHMSELKSENKYQLFFAGGYRSMIMASILKARGFNHIVSVNGGFKAIKELNKLELTEYVCPTTLL
jgi:hydroxyacylglutathione hydrolase